MSTDATDIHVLRASYAKFFVFNYQTDMGDGSARALLIYWRYN